MSVVTDARDALNAVLASVEGVRVYAEAGANIDPPALFVGPATLLWESVCSQPTHAQFTVFLMVPNSERAIDQLAELVVFVAEAVDADPDMAVRRADPNSAVVGSTELPTYEVLVDVTL